MKLGLRHAGLLAVCLGMVACFNFGTSSSSGSCASGISFPSFKGDVQGPPRDDGTGPRGAPSDPAPTGQAWKEIEDDRGCGRSTLRWVLVDEICGNGEGTDPRTLESPMFRDGARIGTQLYAVDATHLWSLDLSDPQRIARTSLTTGFGQPLSVAARGSELFMAAGLDGLVVVDATDPASPKRKASLGLPTPAFDVELAGDRAYVAAGAGGLAEITLGTGAPTLSHASLVPGYATGVAADATNVYVAACSTFAVFDRATLTLKSKIWTPNAMSGERLVAPAKDVALVGSVAFVAAGKLGAVAIDVQNPAAPSLLGACRVEDQAFYASGVRAQGSTVFVAGGEYGVLRIDATDPRSACRNAVGMVHIDPPDLHCSEMHPWENVPWEEVWSPPLPGKDPVQVLPTDDALYAFGDARRIGVRAIDVRDKVTLAPRARYDEPRMLTALAVDGQRAVLTGARGGVFRVDGGALLARLPDLFPTDASTTALLPDGRWVALATGALHVEGRAQPIVLPPTGRAQLTVRGKEVIVASSSGLLFVDVDSGTSRSASLVATAALPPSIAVDARAIYYAAPEWTAASSLPNTDGGTPRPVAIRPHGVFDEEDILDTYQWQVRVPRRYLATSPRGLVELAALGAHAGLVLHADHEVRVTLPPLTYSGLAVNGDHAYAVGLERGLYKSYLVTVSLAGSGRLVSVEAFTGGAAGVGVAGERIYVADADGAIRVYSANGDGVAPLGLVRVEARP
jgi:hypothetical protein